VRNSCEAVVWWAEQGPRAVRGTTRTTRCLALCRKRHHLRWRRLIVHEVPELTEELIAEAMARAEKRHLLTRRRPVLSLSRPIRRCPRQLHAEAALPHRGHPKGHHGEFRSRELVGRLAWLLG
jgi:hypothetical protein